MPAPARAADPTTADCLASNERSITLRNQHQLRAARGELLVCAAESCPEDIRNECARRVSEVNALMPTIVFEAKDRADNDTSRVSVTMDGQILAERLEGTALSIDPGEHVFVFSMEGEAPVEKRLVIREGEKGRRERVVLGGSTASAAPPSAAPSVVVASSEPQPMAADADRGKTVRRVLGIIVGGIGVISVGVAVYQQITANAHYADSERAAGSMDRAVADKTSRLYERASDAQTLGIIFGAAGAVAIGAGTVLVLTSLGGSATNEHAATSLTPVVSPTSAALLYTGSF